MLPKYKVAEVLVCRQQDRSVLVRAIKDFRIGNPGRTLRDRKDLISISADYFDDLPIDALIGDEPHPAIFSAG